jgi:hypothetical protein
MSNLGESRKRMFATLKLTFLGIIMKITRLFGTALPAFLLCAAASTTAQAAFVKTFTGNDCSGEFGQGFDNCKTPFEYGSSPVIAKFNFNDAGTVSTSEINTSLFPSVTGDEWTFAFGIGGTGTWTYNPAGNDPLITYYVAKGGSSFNLFSNDGDPNSGGWFTPTNGGGNPAGLSHLTFYDTGVRPPQEEVPEPASLALLGLGLLGVVASRRVAKGKKA